MSDEYTVVQFAITEDDYASPEYDQKIAQAATVALGNKNKDTSMWEIAHYSVYTNDMEPRYHGKKMVLCRFVRGTS